jgi:cytochrome c-type biogenesis protein CcsB
MSILEICEYKLPIFGSFGLFFLLILNLIKIIFSKNKNLDIASSFILICVNFSFFISLLTRWIVEKYFPLSNLYEGLLFLVYVLTAIILILEQIFQMRNKMIQTTIVSLSFFTSFFANFTLPLEMQKASPLVPSLQSNWLMMHVSMMMLSYGSLIIGSLFSIIYLLSHFRKKINQENKSYFNTLATVDIWSYRIIGIGFPLLTIGIISGAVWANEAWGSYWSWDPKETWALITWLIFASYLHSRIVKKWDSIESSKLGAVGFVSIWICFLGVNFLAKGLHSYGWIS